MSDACPSPKPRLALAFVFCVRGRTPSGVLCLRCARTSSRARWLGFSDLCVGIKVRLSADAANDGKNEKEAYVRALQACELAGVPLMTHHTFSTVPLTECPGADASPVKMRKGDLYTHTFHGFEVKPSPTAADRCWLY